MTVKTHRMNTRRESERYTCFACTAEAHYWSQDSLKGGIATGAVVWHCQAHREAGRKEAASDRAKARFMQQRSNVQEGDNVLAQIVRKLGI